MDIWLGDNGKTWNVLGRLSKAKFITGKRSILYSAKAASNLNILGRTMSHETAHAMSRALNFPYKSVNRTPEVSDDFALGDVEYLAIRKLEYTFLKKNLILPQGQGLPAMIYIDKAISLLDKSQRFLYDYLIYRSTPLFNFQYKFPVK